MLFDTHAQMDDHGFNEDRSSLLEQLPKEGIGLLMNPGCSLASSRNAIALAEAYDYIYAAVGSHPDAADEVNDEVIGIYRELAKHPKVKAIGEIGLDYHYEDIPRQLQKKAFRLQLELARELDLPVIVHMRDAWEDCMTILEEFPEVGGVFHCYSGSLVYRLYRCADLQKCPQSCPGGRKHPPGSHRAGNGLPLYVPGALPGQAQRSGKALPHGAKVGSNPGDHRGRGPKHYNGKRQAAVPAVS